ncbi:unnamed protein product, partial [Prorocentrum cordatum]
SRPSPSRSGRAPPARRLRAAMQLASVFEHAHGHPCLPPWPRRLAFPPGSWQALAGPPPESAEEEEEDEASAQMYSVGGPRGPLGSKRPPAAFREAAELGAPAADQAAAGPSPAPPRAPGGAAAVLALYPPGLAPPEQAAERRRLPAPEWSPLPPALPDAAALAGEPPPPAWATRPVGLAGEQQSPHEAVPRLGDPSLLCGRSSQPRLYVHILLHMQVAGFDLVPRLIGHRGCNMRRIATATGAKVRIRGRGSGFLEGKHMREAPTPLMVAIATRREEVHGFVKAVGMTLQTLHGMEEAFRSHCHRQRVTHQGPCASVEGPARDFLADALQEAPWAGDYFSRRTRRQA